MVVVVVVMVPLPPGTSRPGRRGPGRAFQSEHKDFLWAAPHPPLRKDQASPPGGAPEPPGGKRREVTPV